MGFEVGMRVEVMDRRNPILVRVASMQEVKEHQVLVHFDGWPQMYDYWVDDDSPDIKPPGWCSRTGGTLQPPSGEWSPPRPARTHTCQNYYVFECSLLRSVEALLQAKMTTVFYGL